MANATDAEIQKEIVRCLYGPMDRDGGRKARMEKKAAKSAITVGLPVQPSNIDDSL